MSKANPAHPVQLGLSASVCDETLRSFAGYSMKRAFNVVQADLSRALEPFGLRMMTFTALILIVDNPDLSQTALAGALAMERSNLVTIIDELENSGWILRNPAPNDRRSYALHATPAGEELCREAVASALAHEARLLAALGEGGTARLIDALMIVERGKDR
jgi:DNA-binding MarR family transcriptional regulator